VSAKRYIKLTPEEDEQLRKVEQTAGLGAKVKLRATILRLSNQGWDIERLVQYTKRSRWSILRDFDRWEVQGIQGLADATSPGNPLQVTEEVRAFLQERLGEDRAWNAAQLADEVRQKFTLQMHPQTIRHHLHLMGYGWKRTRYIPAQAPDPDAEHAARAALETLKRGHVQENSA
jgi:transposase